MNQPYAELDDIKLASLARDDHNAFDALYRRYVTPVYRYCYARTDAIIDAEDLTAQTFLAALESIESFKRTGSFAGWLFGIARRKCADFHRGHYTHPTTALDGTGTPGESTPEAEQLPDPEAENPEDVIINASVIACLERMLPQLSEDRQEAVRLRYWGGLSMSDIAKAMRRTEAAIKMLVSRAISDLRERCYP